MRWRIIRVLHLGCGEDTFGDVRVDSRLTSATTNVWDLELGIPFAENSFDLVFSKNLLEHLRNVGFHLDECYRVLKKGGKVDVTTDHAGCSRFYWRFSATHDGRYEKLHPGDKHFSIFTRTHLLNHFEKSGFKNIRVEFVGTDTLGRWVDLFTGQNPRIRVTGEKL